MWCTIIVEEHRDINVTVHSSFVFTYHRHLYHLISIGTNGSWWWHLPRASMVSNVDVRRVNWKGVGGGKLDGAFHQRTHMLHQSSVLPTLKNSAVIQRYNNQQLRMDWDIHNNIHSINNNTHDMGR